MSVDTAVQSWDSTWESGVSTGTAANAALVDHDRILIERCLHGDNGAWEHLVRSHTRLVYGACYRFTGRPEEATDLTQEVFLRVFRRLSTFDPQSGSFRTWLLRLARNLLIDHYRKHRKERVVDSLEDQLAGVAERKGVAARADYALAGREAGECLQSGLQKLSPELREAVILRDFESMEYKEIAAVLQVPEGTVKSRINRGRRELARQLRAMGVQG